jgi:undecaprenyl-diphosphatase
MTAFSRVRPIALSCAAALTFVLIAASVERGGWIVSVDARVETWLHALASPALTTFAIAISFLGAPSTLTVAAVAACFVLARHLSRDRVWVALALAVGGNLLNYGLKSLFHRGRPSFEAPLLILSGYGFPSGHAMAATVFYGFAIGVLVPVRRRPDFALAGGVSMIALVGFSRVYLGVHYVSDVLAGILEAIAWSTLVLASWRSWQLHRGVTAASVP